MGRKKITKPKKYFERKSFLEATAKCWNDRNKHNLPFDIIDRVNAVFSLFEKGFADVLTRVYLGNKFYKPAIDITKFQPVINNFRKGLQNKKSDIHDAFKDCLPYEDQLLIDERNNELIEKSIVKDPHFEPLFEDFYKGSFYTTDYFIITAYWEIYNIIVAFVKNDISEFMERLTHNFGLLYDRRLMPTGNIGEFGGRGVIKGLDLIQMELLPKTWLGLINRDLTRIYMLLYMKPLMPKHPVLKVCKIEDCRFLFFGSHNAEYCAVHKNSEKETLRKRETRSIPELENTVFKLISSFTGSKLSKESIARIEKIDISNIPKDKRLYEAERLCRHILRLDKVDKQTIGSIEHHHSIAYYNLACIYSLRKEITEAMMYLERAIEMGFDNEDLIHQDSDLNNIWELYQKKC